MVFAAFAAPWQLRPTRPRPIDAVATAHLLMLHARGITHAEPEPLHDVLSRLQATDLDRDDLPTPLETIDSFGGLVEGLLLVADADGTPRDEFAWCLTIQHPLGVPLGRIVVPAARSQSRWRSAVDNIIAGIALSSWHEPVDLHTTTTSRTRDGDTDLIAAGTDIYVLDIETTSPHRPVETTAAGRRHRPHLRRGHWRRQRTGPGRTQLRWTWVRATTVNTARSAAPQVYRLPVLPLDL
jgi:hypothetical protein